MPTLTEDGLREINGLVARARRLEGDYLRTRSVRKGDELWVELDGIRWRLQHFHDVHLPPFKHKARPEGKDIS